MGTVLASKIAADAAELLFDEDGRFTTSDHLKFINAGQKQALIFKPDISVSNSAVQLAAGTKQSISATGISFIKLTRNMGLSPGATPGKVIYHMDMDALDNQDADWHTATPSATIELYTFDPKDPKHFYIYPPQPGTGQGYAEQVECVLPTEIALIGDVITIDDIYETALLNYDVYRCCLIDAKQSDLARQLAAFHYTQFVQILTGKEMSETQSEPK